MLNPKTAIFTAVAIAAALFAAPAAQATPISYDFTVTVLAGHGPLGGTVASGSFTYDSSSITPGSTVYLSGLLTGLDFIWNGTAFTSTTANTGYLTFNAGGQLTDFFFGDDCFNGYCMISSSTDWATTSQTFTYSDGTNAYTGGVTYSQAGPSVPEPDNLPMFASGLLLTLGSFEFMRRRQRG